MQSDIKGSGLVVFLFFSFFPFFMYLLYSCRERDIERRKS